MLLLTEERFGGVAAAARQNIQSALDLIAIHAEKPVRGDQPRAKLNPLTIVAAVGSWERFIGDLIVAATVPDDPHTGSPRSGQLKSEQGAHWPDKIDGRLRTLGILSSNLTDVWEAAFPAGGWIGVALRGWVTVRHDSSPELRTELREYVMHTKFARNAAAHRSLLLNANGASGGDHQNGWYAWKADTKDPSLQSGYARGVTAVYLQLVDSTITVVARKHGWDPSPHRLPADWFRADQSSPRYAGTQFWGGAELHRTTA